MSFTGIDQQHMRRALELARRGQGLVEPNPMVGCVIAHDERVVGEGWHEQFGGPHAEVQALRAAGANARGATAYVTLEPCCHYGKTPPCTEALIAAGVARVVAAMSDPFPAVAGKGAERLRQSGIAVHIGLLKAEAAELNAPYLKLTRAGRPWVIAKWAMTLDGKLATREGLSRWISGDRSRQIVHQLRGRVDAIIVGKNTVVRDDPLLTPRPPGPKLPLRIVLDTRGTLPENSRLAATAREAPVLVVVGPECAADQCARLTSWGCEVLAIDGPSRSARLMALLDELGRRRMTNVLVEGGSEVFGALFDARLIDEVHVFVASKLFGGRSAPTPIGGEGEASPENAVLLRFAERSIVGDDFYLYGRLTDPMQLMANGADCDSAHNGGSTR